LVPANLLIDHLLFSLESPGLKADSAHIAGPANHDAGIESLIHRSPTSCPRAWPQKLFITC